MTTLNEFGIVHNDNTTVISASLRNRYAIFGFGNNYVSYTNLVNYLGGVATDLSGVGTARERLAAAGYGGDKAIFGFGMYQTGPTPTIVRITNLVSNTGVVASDQAALTGTARADLAAAGYGGDKAIFGFGSSNLNMTNLVSNLGVVAADQAALTGTGRSYLAAAGYGGDKAIFGFGYTGSNVNITNLVSNTGVVAADTTGVGTARYALAAAGYGGDKAIFGYGYAGSDVNITNKVSNLGVVDTDTTGVGTARDNLAAASYG